MRLKFILRFSNAFQEMLILVKTKICQKEPAPCNTLWWSVCVSLVLITISKFDLSCTLEEYNMSNRQLPYLTLYA